MAQPSRQELEETWLQKVKRAAFIYRQASEHHTRMARELQHGQIAPADGEFAVAHAWRAEALARNHYARTIQVYADLVVSGKIPPQEQDDELLI